MEPYLFMLNCKITLFIYVCNKKTNINKYFKLTELLQVKRSTSNVNKIILKIFIPKEHLCYEVLLKNIDRECSILHLVASPSILKKEIRNKTKTMKAFRATKRLFMYEV